jgi:hypothetical protein
VLFKKDSELCELCASAVSPSYSRLVAILRS